MICNCDILGTDFHISKKQETKLMSLISQKAPICDILDNMCTIKYLMEICTLATAQTILEYKDKCNESITIADLTKDKGFLGYCMRNRLHGASIVKYLLSKYKMDVFYPNGEIFSLTYSWKYMGHDLIKVLIEHLILNFPQETKKYYGNCIYIPIEIRRQYNLI